MALAMYPSGTGNTEVKSQESQPSHMVMELQQSRNEKVEKRLIRQGSVSENFFAVKNAALILPKKSAFGEPTGGSKTVVFGGDLKTHLHAIIDILRPQDKVKLVARLESWDTSRTRYLVIVSTVGRQDTDESIIIGIDFSKNEHTKCTIGLVIPIWSDTAIKLDGDGGFKVTGSERTHTFKPISVQALWAAYQSIHHCISSAQKNNYYFGSLYLTWTCYYESRVTSPRLFLNEWEYIDEVYSRPRYYFTEVDGNRQSTELKIRESLKEVMMKMDLDNCNSRDIRQELEKQTDLDLKEFKEYIDTEMMTILGQMDTASKILDYLYLGSEWNASNCEELAENGITHILNITKEVDNFFPDDFVYKNIRCRDEPMTDLLPCWNDTWKYIRKARKAGGKCLVHCKMGISRSAATVIAFVMKENHWSMDKSLSFVRDRRPIVLPNKGFMLQLREYEGILNASAQRHNFLFRSLSESNLSSDHGAQEENSEEDVQTTPEQVYEPQDDFNRRLLDLTLLPNRFDKPRHKRSKSWSVGDCRHCGPDDLVSPECTEEGNSFTVGHMSEPQDLLNHSTSSAIGKSTVKETRLAEKRKRWKRRHTERIIPFRDFDLDIRPQSEDSVFVNPGIGNVASEYWLVETVKGAAQGRDPLCPHTDAQDKETSTNTLDVEVPVHSSLASPMNSPSFKSTEKVNVTALRSHFDDDSNLKIDVTDSSSPVVLQPEQTKEILGTPVLATQTTADFGNVKKAPRSDSPYYGRSLSDSQMCKVKDIVSDIESRCSGELFSELERRAPIVENAENLHGDAGWRHDGNSDGGIISTPAITSCLPTEAVCVPNEVSIIEKDCNQNNNNCSACCQTTSAATPNEKAAEVESAQHPEGAQQTNERARSLTQSELTVIREVGKTFLGESDSSDSELLSESFEGCDSSGTERKSSSSIKRGIVRRMARMIENRLKRQVHYKPSTGKNSWTDSLPMISESSRRQGSAEFAFADEGKRAVMLNVGVSECSTDNIHEGVLSTASYGRSVVTTKHSNQTIRSASSVSGIINLVAPTPYSPVRESFSKMRKIDRGARQPVRRSQSERSFNHQSKRYLTGASAICQPADFEPSSVEDLHRVSTDEVRMDSQPTPLHVKNTIKLFENHDAAAVSGENATPESRLTGLDLAAGGVMIKTLAARRSEESCVAPDVEYNAGANSSSVSGKCRWISRDNCLYQTI